MVTFTTPMTYFPTKDRMKDEVPRTKKEERPKRNKEEMSFISKERK
jgi:hypothetical protein